MKRFARILFKIVVFGTLLGILVIYFSRNFSAPKKIESRVSGLAPTVPHPAPLITDPTCLKTYQVLFAEPSSLDFRVIFGYKDARPARYVGDRYERAYFIQKLLDYGFKRNPINESSFTFELLGLDGQTKIVHLQVEESSVGPDDDQNKKDPFQKWKSQNVEDLFLTGLKESKLVFYYGHSRDGGGPDFTPPKVRKDLHTDYGWYIRHHPGLDKMIKALKNTPTGPSVLGLFSCVSDRHFNRAILEVKPDLAILGSTTLLYYKDALDGMMESLSDILEMKCQQDFRPTGIQVINLFN